MKTPFQGRVNIEPTNLPEPVKAEFLGDSSPRYFRVALPKPLRQRGHEFSFVVVPVKLTPELIFSQCGKGVLCQTEAEAKESMELLSERDKEPIVVAQWEGCGIVGKVTNIRRQIGRE